MTAKEAIDNLEYLISEDCTESQFDYIDEIEMAIMALGAIDQIIAERDIAESQLKEIGVSLGEKMDWVKVALEKQTEKKPKDRVSVVPTIETVPVVRCKDCIYYETGKDYLPYCNCVDGGISDYPREMDYCSYGKRKD